MSAEQPFARSPAGERRIPLLPRPRVADPDRAAFSRQRLSGAIRSGSEGVPPHSPLPPPPAPPLGFSCIALRKPSGSGRLAPRGWLPAELSSGNASLPRQRAGPSPAARRPAPPPGLGHRSPRLSEEGPAAPSTDTALTVGPKGWVAFLLKGDSERKIPDRLPPSLLCRSWHGVKEQGCSRSPVAEGESEGLCRLQPVVFQGS